MPWMTRDLKYQPLGYASIVALGLT